MKPYSAAANSTASFANGLDKPGGGFVKASVARGPDGAGAFTLRLDGGREISVVVEEGDAKAGMTPGQNVLVNLSDGKILVPNAAQPPAAGQPQTSAQIPLAGQSTPPLPAGTPPQPAPPPILPFVSVNADTFIAGGLATQIRDGLESPLLRSLPAELIEKIAAERGGIDVAALNALDAVLRNRSLPVDASSPLALERLEQWLRIALDNPKLAEDLADRIPLAGAREIIDRLLQLQKFGANFLPNDILRLASAERFFLGNDGDAILKNILGDSVNNDAGASRNAGLGAGGVLNNASGNIANNGAGAGQNAGLGAGDAISNASGNTANGNLLKELFVKAFSAAPAALLDLVGRIDSSDINAGNVKLPREEARRIVGELANRLPAQAAGKPELLHNMKPLPPHIAESVAPSTISDKTDSATAPTIQNRAEPSGAAMKANIAELPNAHTIHSRADSSGATVKADVANELPNTHIIRNRTVLSDTNIIPDKTESPTAHIIPNRPESSDAAMIPGRTELPHARTMPGKADSSAAPEPPSVQTPQTPAGSPPEHAREARHPVPHNIYDRIESAPRFNIPAESKNAVFSQIDKALEVIRQTVGGSAYRETVARGAANGNTHTDGKPALQPTQQTTNSAVRFTQQASVSGAPPLPQPQQTPTAVQGGAVVGQKAGYDIDGGNIANRHTARFTQQASVSGTRAPLSPPPSSPQAPRAQTGEVVVKQETIGNINTDMDVNKPAVQFKQQATVSEAPPLSQSQRSEQGETAVKQEAIGNIHTNINANNPTARFTRQAAVSEISPPSQPQRSGQGEAAVKQEATGNIHTDIDANKPAAQFTRQATDSDINAVSNDNEPDAAPDVLTRAARRLLANAEKLRAGFESAFSSLELQSRVFPSDFSGVGAPSAVRQSLDALRLETLLNASKALQDIFSIVEELRGAAEFFSDKSRESTDAERLLARAAENLARQARRSGNEIADKLGGILRELNRMQLDGSRGDGGLAARQSPAEIMRSAALTAASGLESLQLLASTARGQELQQQVVALPVKIGDEWTEVQVKIIKEREREGKGKERKKKGDGHVSVYLNAAPSALGEVTAHLDYYPPASLKLSFQFGKPEAAKWFRERAGALREALAAAGFSGAALDFRTKPRPARAQDADNQTVTPSVAGGGAGIVDFRA